MIKIVNKENNIRYLSEHSISAFIDNSGSTSSRYLNKSLLDIEIFLANKLIGETNNMVYWNSDVSFGSNICSTGGTYPDCIFKNNKSKQLFDSSDVILFFTDGEINQREVTSFSGELNSRLNKALYICVIVNGNFDNLSSLDISVIAPMMLASNVLCLYHNANKNKNVVIASKGSIEKIYPNPTKMEFEDLQEVNLEDLSKLRISSQNLPDECIVINETDDIYKLIDINKLYTQENLILELDENEWINLIKHSIVSNNLPKLRHIITRSQSIELEKLQNDLKNNHTFPNVKKRDQIIDNMTQAYISGNFEEQNRLKLELDTIRDIARKEEVESMQFLRKNMDNAKKKWNVIRNMIHNIETGYNKYNLDNFSFASNRASRAGTISIDKLEEYENMICYENCPEIDCAIHLDKGPCVLWLQKYDDIEYTTNDFCLNYPLSTYPKLRKILISNPVCGNCANSYFKYTNKSVYRENIDGYIPLNWNYNQNIKFSRDILCKIFCENKSLPHVKMLLLSVIDDLENVEWFESYRKYFRDQLMNNIYTTSTFSEEGSKVSLSEALKCIIKDEPNLLRQPFQAASRILKLSLEQGNNVDNIIDMTQKRFAYLLVELYCNFVKNDCNHNINERINCILYENLCCIPIENRNKIVTLKNEPFLKFIGNDKNNFILSLEKIFDIANKNIYDYISDKFIVNILWNLSKQTIHEKPLTVYTNLMKNEKTFRNLNEVKDIYEQMNQEKFGRYKKLIDKYMPGFAFYNGKYSCPSKLFFRDEPLWTDDMANQIYDIGILSEILKFKLQHKMTEYYGSYYPTHNSAHIMLHRIVSKVIENKYNFEKKINDDIIIDCIKDLAETRGNYGNIYSESTLGSIICVINDFFRIKNTPNYSSGDKEIDQSNHHKLKSELLSYGMECDGNNVLFKPELIGKPIMISYKLDNIDELVFEINNRFSNTL